MAAYEVPTPDQMRAYQAALNGVPGGRQIPLDTSNMGAPQTPVPKPRTGFRGILDRIGITILGADAGRVLFPPQQPLQPIAQDVDQFAVGRPWDYPVGLNTRVIPRDSQISFATLRNLARDYDLLAVMIGRVKDKIVSQRWNIGPRDEKSKATNDPRIKEVTGFLEYPDKDHSFDDWTRMLLDQVIMYDAPAIWLRTDRANRLYSMEIIDGSLITPKIGPDGRVPTAEYGPGYQQVLKGLPAVDYVKPVPKGVVPPLIEGLGIPFPELLYKPRNPRVDSLYGYGPVEQIITTVNIALRREAYLLSYYTDGSTPDLLLSTPKEWSEKQIANFQVWWDSVLSGNLAGRRGTKFVPDGVALVDTKERVLTDQTDEWLTRICCFALGLNPMPFVKQMNRGQEKTHHDEAAQEGLEPWLEWFANLLNGVIALKFGYPDIVFRWKEDESTDEQTRATIDQILVNAKIYHPDEIRAKRGDEAMPDDLREQMDMATFSQTANATILSEDQQAAKDDAAMAIAAAKPAPVLGAPAQKPAAPEKSVDAPAPVVNHFKFDAPQIHVAPPSVTVTPAPVNVTAPTVNIAPPSITVHTPEVKPADVFVDIGATNVSAKMEQPKREGDRSIAYERDADGNLVAKVTESTTRILRGKRGDDGRMIVKAE
jgi:Phage portal protein